MNISIDTTAKTIVLNQDTKLSELYEFLKDKFPETWKEYKIITGGGNTHVYYPYYPQLPTWEVKPYEITCGSTTINTEYLAGKSFTVHNTSDGVAFVNDTALKPGGSITIT